MKTLLLGFFAIAVAGCQTQRPIQHLDYSGGDGSSCQQAVVIAGASVREVGVLAQKLWLEQRYPGYRQTKDSLLTSNSRQFEMLELATLDGQTGSVYFDVTDWWQK